MIETPAPLPQSPMIRAYAAASASAPGHLVLYRVGEFYEVLYGDAVTVSRALGIQLTRRRQKDGDDIPMCGIPASSADGSIARLLSAGHKVALSEHPVGGTSDRMLILRTPATSVDAAVVPGDRANNLTAAYSEGEAIALAWIDLSTGDSGTCMTSLLGCGPALARIDPSEVLVIRWPEGSDALAVALRSAGTRSSDMARPVTPADEADTLLAAAYGPGHAGVFRGFSPPELIALTSLLNYVRATVGKLPDRLVPPRRALMGDTMEIDAPTLRGLEVLSSASGREGSLLSVIDRTVTPAGARLLARQLAAPLTSSQQICRRLAMVRFLVANPQIRASCREELSSLPDMLRACGRLSLGKAGPRDLAAVRDSLDRIATVAQHLRDGSDLPPGLVSVTRDLAAASERPCHELAHDLRRGLIPAPPMNLSDPGFIADGYRQRLDAARADMTRAREAIKSLQARFVRETDIKALRIKTNTLVGYHVEVPVSDAAKLGPNFTLRQGLASSTRFSVSELDLLAAQLEDASDRAEVAEQAAFVELSNQVMALREVLARIAHAAAALDLVAGLAQAAAEHLWSEPEVVDDTTLEIELGRHPVAEVLLEAQQSAFVPNDCRMSETDRIWLLTGPNMAGKSTFLRQVALIVLMTQTGSFVPAKRARIGIVDKLFSRIGASDDLAAGRSTFLVEMLETSAILNQATARSFVILDEVGRGTSTHDGLAIAQASMEYLHDVVGCRTLFATHYHELADAADAMLHATCMAMDASAGRHGAIFTYKLARGRSRQSYGLKIAALAGMPAAVLSRAESLLRVLKD